MKGLVPVNPNYDKPICTDCLKELFDKSSRRYFYPFIGCNNCGSFYSTGYTDAKPFFKICSECEIQYNNELIPRRYRYAFISCPKCGPKMNTEKYSNYYDIFSYISELLSGGQVIILKTSSMFYFLCDATNEKSVDYLRKVKKTFKPLPVMFKNPDMLRKFVDTNEYINNPVSFDISVIRYTKSKLASNIAQGNYLGVSFANDPFFVLIFSFIDFPLVFSSVNISSESPYTSDQEVLEKFSSYVKIFLNNLEFKNIQDFSVVYNDLGVPTRRGLGRVGNFFESNYKFRDCICLGPELESSVCISKNKKIFLSTRLGHLLNAHVYGAYEKLVDDLVRMADYEVVVCDLHPYYLSTKLAKKLAEQKGVPLKQIQHHKAHIYSLILDRKIDGKIIGFSFDGTGYGEDGKIWGGEVFIGDFLDLRRVAHFKYIPIVAGDSAIENPVFIALSYVSKYLPEKIDLFKQVNKLQKDIVMKQISTETNVFYTSSVGRLFDIAAVLLKIKEDHKIAFSGQAAIELENLATKSETEKYLPFEIHHQNGSMIYIDMLETFRAIIELRDKNDYSDLARMFHNTIVESIYRVALILRDKHNINKVGFSGGVFQNKILCYTILKKFRDFDIYFHRNVPPNDSGIALGQLNGALEEVKV
ncbi:MAG: Sua5/YciO/YrdC/YwlC family protein [Candidatus Calescibacterium sp.]|nr:Sua5/YciO/YrdC/YwlC family protein [Candidatus Calescibacterium sp.]